MKYLRCLLLAGAVFFFGSSKASAASIQFVLDCTIISNVACTPGGPFGTVTLTDNANLVDVIVDMVSSGPPYPYIVSLNWNTVFGTLPQSGWTVTPSPGTSILKFSVLPVGNPGNDVDPYGRFDIAIWDNVNPLADPLQFSLGNTTLGNLDVAMFIAKDDVNQLWAGVKVANEFNNTDRACPTCYGALTAVPEPGTLVLVGLGLLTAASAARRRMRKNVS